MNRMQSAGRSPLVLVVDDHEDTRQMSLIVLRSQGFSAMAAVGGESGFVCASEQQPDVIVTDLAMPDGDGWEFVQRLASDARTKHIPVVMLTAHESESDKKTGFSVGATQYLTKPFGPLELIDTIRGILAHS